ncbi:MAG TPA: hypothetical protein VGL86_08910 [Polyangia bacterium]|jgi:hypothetical protein
MDDLDLIASYVRQLEEALARAGRPTQPLVDETAAHLVEDAARIARVEGCGDDEAARRAIAQFGDVSAVVAASRKHGRAIAASVARIASLVILAVFAWTAFETCVDEAMWPGPIEHSDVAWILLIFAELTGVTIVLFRALGGGGASRALILALQLNAAVALALLVAGVASDVTFLLSGQRPLDLVDVLIGGERFLWALILIHAAAGLRALGGSRTRDGELLAAR